MRKFSSQMALGALVAALGLAAAGCSQIGMLKAKMAFKDANQLYQQQDYQGAAAVEDTRRLDRCTDPEPDRRLLLPGQQLRQPVPPGAAGRGRPTTRC